MTGAIIVTGTISSDRVLTLDEPLVGCSGRVRLVIESLPEPTGDTPPPNEFLAMMERVWDGQRQRGHIPPTPEEVERRIRELRDDWKDE
jgi:hypothetical protein